MAQALTGNQKLKELDISRNEFGPNGFQAICDALPTCKLQVLTCNNNFLGDEVLAYFSNIITEHAEDCLLKKFDCSSCRLNDSGLLYLINALGANGRISNIKLVDNFLPLTEANKNMCVHMQTVLFMHFTIPPNLLGAV